VTDVRTCVRLVDQGSPYANFRGSLETRRLSIVLAAAAELAQIGLEDAREILALMAQERDPRFDRAAARWVGRLLMRHLR
jgi:HEAT repeat protein